MPDFVLNRTHALRSTRGHIINFIKGAPQYVPPELVAEAVAIGAVFVDGTVYDPLGPEAVVEVELSNEQRREAMFKSFVELERRDVRGDYNAQGLPNVKAVEKIVGFTPSNQERNEAFQLFREAKAE